MTALSCAKSLSLLFSSVETFLVSLEYKANISKRKRKERNTIISTIHAVHFLE